MRLSASPVAFDQPKSAIFTSIFASIKIFLGVTSDKVDSMIRREDSLTLTSGLCARPFGGLLREDIPFPLRSEEPIFEPKLDPTAKGKKVNKSQKNLASSDGKGYSLVFLSKIGQVIIQGTLFDIFRYYIQIMQPAR